MKKFGYKIFTLLFVLFITAFAFGTNKLTAEQKAKLQLQKIDNACDLTDQQEADVLEILINRIELRKANKKNVKNDEKVAEKTSLKSATVGKTLKDVLTPEQFEKLQAIRKKK